MMGKKKMSNLKSNIQMYFFFLLFALVAIVVIGKPSGDQSEVRNVQFSSTV